MRKWNIYLYLIYIINFRSITGLNVSARLHIAGKNKGTNNSAERTSGKTYIKPTRRIFRRISS